MDGLRARGQSEMSILYVKALASHELLTTLARLLCCRCLISFLIQPTGRLLYSTDQQLHIIQQHYATVNKCKLLSES